MSKNKFIYISFIFFDSTRGFAALFPYTDRYRMISKDNEINKDIQSDRSCTLVYNKKKRHIA